MHPPLLTAIAVTLPAVGLAVGLAFPRDGSLPEAGLLPAALSTGQPGPEASVTLLGPGGHRRVSLKGLVMEVDVGGGRLLIEVEGKQRLLYGTPPQLTGLAPGDAVAAGVRSYGQQSWLWPPSEAAEPERFITSGVLTGPVGELGRTDGRLEIGGELFSAHPAALSSLAPGQRVSVRYALVGGERWALSIEADDPPGTVPRL